MDKDINKKIDLLINKISEFEESEVVYILVEMYKKAESKWKDQFKKEIPYIVFFRNWVVHTEINQKFWLKIADINDGNNIKTDQLQKEIFLLLETLETKIKIQSMWSSFEKKLMAVLKDQPVREKNKILIQI